MSTVEQNAPAEEGPRSFTVFLRDLAEGEAESELSYHLHELCKKLQEEAAARHDKAAGEIVLKIRLIADHKDNVVVAYSIDAKAPKRKTSAAVYWLTKGGNLTPENPRQQKLSFKDVSKAKQPPREVNVEREAREV